MNAIRTIEKIPSGTNVRGIAKNINQSTFLELEKLGESAKPYTTERVAYYYRPLFVSKLPGEHAPVPP